MTNSVENPFRSNPDLISFVNSITKDNDASGNVIIVGVPEVLVRQLPGSQIRHKQFSFAYSIADDSVIYGKIDIPVENAAYENKRYTIDLGATDTVYICTLIKNRQLLIAPEPELTASQIQALYYGNRDAYYSYLKNRAGA